MHVDFLHDRSARTRRKAENKKWSLKEGSVNEEFALVDALAKIIKAVDGLKGYLFCYILILCYLHFLNASVLFLLFTFTLILYLTDRGK